MTLRSVALTSCVLSLLTGCASPQAIGGPPANEVWVSQVYSGGTQCDASAPPYEPPDVAELLRTSGIVVIETVVEPMGVCAACGCPGYAGRHYALIERSGLAEAQRLGFEDDGPPDYSWL
jgi:hypothetical protein